MFFNVLEYAIHWPTPNYENPERRGHGQWVVTGIFMFMATVAVWVRLWQRLYVRRWFGVDDFLILLSWLCSIGISVLIGIGTKYYGWDRHLWDINPDQYHDAAYLLYISRLMWSMATSFVRLSVLCLYYRLLRAASAPRGYYIANHVMLASTIILLLYYLLSQVFACAPIHAYWAWPPVPGAKCMNDGLSLTVSASVNTLSEFAVATLPLIAVFRLRVDQRQQWAVIGVLCLGYFVVLAGCIRTYYLYKVFFSGWDISWWATPQWISTEVELDTAIICACAAPLRPVVTRVARKVRGAHQEYPEKPSRSWFRAPNMNNTSQLSGSTMQDVDAVNEWTSKMNRTIDLEGIRSDGFGYSVKISGPVKKDPMQQLHDNLVMAGLTRPSRQHSRTDLSTRNQRSQPRTKRSRPTQDKLRTITADTEVEISEAPNEFVTSTGGAWGSGTVPTYDENNPGWDNVMFSNLDSFTDGDTYTRPTFSRQDTDTQANYGTSGQRSRDAEQHEKQQSPSTRQQRDVVTRPSQTPLVDQRQLDLSVDSYFFESRESLDALPPVANSNNQKRAKR